MATRHNLPVNTPSDLLHSPGWCRWLPCNTGKAIFKLALLCDLIYLRDVRCTCSNRSKLLWVGRQQELARSPTSPGLARDDVLSEQAGHLSGVAWLGGTEAHPTATSPSIHICLTGNGSPGHPAQSTFTGVQGRDARRRCKICPSTATALVCTACFCFGSPGELRVSLGV